MAQRSNLILSLTGNLGKDPEVRTSTSGNAVGTLQIATQHYSRQSKQNETEWHRVIVFGKDAEFARNFLKKGASVIINSDRISHREYIQNGEKKYITEIICRELIPMGSSNTSSNNQYNNECPYPQDSYSQG